MVNKDDAIAQVKSNLTCFDLMAQRSGTVLHLEVEENVPVKIGDLIAVIGDENYQYEKQLKEQLEEITCP